MEQIEDHARLTRIKFQNFFVLPQTPQQAQPRAAAGGPIKNITPFNKQHYFIVVMKGDIQKRNNLLLLVVLVFALPCRWFVAKSLFEVDAFTHVHQFYRRMRKATSINNNIHQRHNWDKHGKIGGKLPLNSRSKDQAGGSDIQHGEWQGREEQVESKNSIPRPCQNRTELTEEQLPSTSPSEADLHQETSPSVSGSAGSGFTHKDLYQEARNFLRYIDEELWLDRYAVSHDGGGQNKNPIRRLDRTTYDKLLKQRKRFLNSLPITPMLQDWHYSHKLNLTYAAIALEKMMIDCDRQSPLSIYLTRILSLPSRFAPSSLLMKALEAKRMLPPPLPVRKSLYSTEELVMAAREEAKDTNPSPTKWMETRHFNQIAMLSASGKFLSLLRGQGSINHPIASLIEDEDLLMGSSGTPPSFAVSSQPHRPSELFDIKRLLREYGRSEDDTIVKRVFEQPIVFSPSGNFLAVTMHYTGYPIFPQESDKNDIPLKLASRLLVYRVENDPQRYGGLDPFQLDEGIRVQMARFNPAGVAILSMPIFDSGVMVNDQTDMRVPRSVKFSPKEDELITVMDNVQGNDSRIVSFNILHFVENYPKMERFSDNNSPEFSMKNGQPTLMNAYDKLTELNTKSILFYAQNFPRHEFLSLNNSENIGKYVSFTTSCIANTSLVVHIAKESGKYCIMGYCVDFLMVVIPCIGDDELWRRFEVKVDKYNPPTTMFERIIPMEKKNGTDINSSGKVYWTTPVCHSAGGGDNVIIVDGKELVSMSLSHPRRLRKNLMELKGEEVHFQVSVDHSKLAIMERPRHINKEKTVNNTGYYAFTLIHGESTLNPLHESIFNESYQCSAEVLLPPHDLLKVDASWFSPDSTKLLCVMSLQSNETFNGKDMSKLKRWAVYNIHIKEWKFYDAITIPEDIVADWTQQVSIIASFCVIRTYSHYFLSEFQSVGTRFKELHVFRW